MFARLTGSIVGFSRDESGSLIQFSLFIFIAMLMFGGIAVDLMLLENKRVHLQNSTDRAVLAAANLDQSLDPKLVVQDYMKKSGLEVSLDDIVVKERTMGSVTTGRQVTVNVDTAHNTLLMDLAGVATLPYGSISEAGEAINDLEISLVLDVSGSMDQGTKLPDLKRAAKDFVTKVLAGAEDGRVSISLVPYSTQVSAGRALLSAMNVTDRHDKSSCVNFAGNTFSTAAINHEVALEQTAHFDPWKRFDDSRGGSKRAPYWLVCRNEAHFDILPWTNDANAINNQIEAFTAGGNTSIDVAVKWGAAMLDPSMRGQVDAMIADTSVTTTPSEFSGRPYDYDREDTLKFIIVMTDGINTTQYTLRSQYKSGPSGIWRDTATGRLSRKVGNDYFYAHNGDWSNSPYDSDGKKNGSKAVELDWREVWADMSMSYRAYELYYQTDYKADDYYDNLYGPRTSINAAEKDSRLASICSAAKAKNVVIFTIGFEVTDASAAVMRNCASTDSHFYRVNDSDLEVAFASIANQINQLKLTQ